MLYTVTVSFLARDKNTTRLELGKAFIDGCVEGPPKNFKGDRNQYKKANIRRKIHIHIDHMMEDLGGSKARVDIS